MNKKHIVCMKLCRPAMTNAFAVRGFWTALKLLSDKSTLVLCAHFDHLHAFPRKYTSLEVRGQLMLSELEPLLSVHIDLHAECRLAQLQRNHFPRSELTPNYKWIPMLIAPPPSPPYRIFTKRLFDHYWKMSWQHAFRNSAEYNSIAQLDSLHFLFLTSGHGTLSTLSASFCKI